MKVLPLQKGSENVLDMLKGVKTSFEVVSTWELEVVATMKGHKKFPPFKEKREGGLTLS